MKAFVVTIGYDQYEISMEDIGTFLQISSRLEKVKHSSDYKSVHYAGDDRSPITEIRLVDITADPNQEED